MEASAFSVKVSLGLSDFALMTHIGFLTVANVFAALILSGPLFHALAVSNIKLFFTLVDRPTCHFTKHCIKCNYNV
jgi:hypothetical protein